MFGYWDALYFVFVFIVGLILAYLLERWAKRSGMGTRETGPGAKMFISGEDPDRIIPGFEHLEGNYTGKNVMWGLTYALKGFFTALRNEHTGLLTDYVSYLVITTAFVMGVLLIWG
ncbi:hydrogenase [Thermococcus waiotapuensis]|uniref:Hydrogenase n=1 Tax=Thermococcus waiotapuensis TaxID=90909 RepID=A0AAE4NTZ4_9EURY|nr:hydrogenase [Thermococcus waiotapuensis]MDV3103814.1 hydrogenase [Thermococcus waiotapuensis]